MKYTAAMAVLAAVVSAQDINIFPQCSLQCIIQGIGTATSCQATDFPCVCKNIDAIKTAATPCVVKQCGIDVALNQVLPATQKFCSEVNTGSSSSGSSSPASPSPASSQPLNSGTTTTTTTVTRPISSPSAGHSRGHTTTTGGGSSIPSQPTSAGSSIASGGGSFATSATGGGSFATSATGGGGSSIPPVSSTGGGGGAAPSSTGVATAGAAVMGHLGGLWMLLLGAVAAL